ncbi:MAG: DUF1553 domain-containing protein [Acidobacteriota bacterium]
MRRVMLAAVFAGACVCGPAATGQIQDPFASRAVPSPANSLDEIVFARLSALGLRPSSLCSDAVFIRRAFLDVIGTLPTADEARSFLEDRDPAKRRALVDRLLERPEFADYWAMKWADTLRVKSEFPINLWPNAVQAYHRWIRASLRDNLPFDEFARALLTSSGSNFREPPVNFYRAVQARDPQSLAAAVALTFMGSRVESWPAERLADLSVFFSRVGYKATGEWKEEIVFFDPERPLPGAAPGSPRSGRFPDGTATSLAPDRDPRVVFADWLVRPGNPWFARAAANRVWYWLMGRGVVHEPDDFRADNPPSSPELLAELGRAFVESRYDMKALMRMILNSTTYQLSPVPAGAGGVSEANFAHAIVRPLDAEVLIDALNQITGGTEQYSSPIPEPFTFVPPGVRSTALADGSITSAFLETFGRPSRDTGLASERSDRPSASQRLYLLNSAEVQRKIQQGPAVQALLQRGGDGRALLDLLYLTILSRHPTEAEMAAVQQYTQATEPNRRALVQDLVWALINTVEFRYRH